MLLILAVLLHLKWFEVATGIVSHNLYLDKTPVAAFSQPPATSSPGVYETDIPATYTPGQAVQINSCDGVNCSDLSNAITVAANTATPTSTFTKSPSATKTSSSTRTATATNTAIATATDTPLATATATPVDTLIPTPKAPMLIDIQISIQNAPASVVVAVTTPTP